MEFLSFSPLFWLLGPLIILAAWRYTLVDQATVQIATSLVLRCLGLVLLILAMCRPFWKTDSDHLHVVYLLDVSESIALDAAQDALTGIQAEIDNLDANDSWSLFAVGNGVRSFTDTEVLDALLSTWQEGHGDATFRSESRLAEALLETRFAFPAGKSSRAILYSDAQETGQDLAKAIQLLREEDVAVCFEPVDSLRQPEAAVVQVQPSTSQAFHAEIIRIGVDVTSNRSMKSTLRLMHRGVTVQEREVDLRKDVRQTVEFDVEMSTPGASLWTAELQPAEDHFPLNNKMTCTVNVSGKARVLALHRSPTEMREWSRALREQDIEIDVRGELGLPENLQGMLAFDAIVLGNLAATSMSPRQMELLKQYVSEFGGGLIMLGSDNSFGLGGYYKTPVEEVLPLVSRYEKEKEKPSLAMTLVIDKSGSMSGVPIALARQAAKAAVELLGPRDMIGIIGFDFEARVVSEMRSAAETDSIQASIDSLAAGGGTYMYMGMQAGKDMLESTTAKIRHMIVLSDGRTQPADHEALVQSLADDGITVSTVALGGADRQLLHSLSELGRGRYYETDDPANVPQIFTKETIQASKSAIKEDLFGSVVVSDHAIISGYAHTDLPFSLGYVMTEAKPTAQVVLVTETGDPLLAVSRYGLGMGLAFTSDLSERWGGEWLAWSECGKFWAQVLRGVVRKTDAAGMEVQHAQGSDEWTIDIRRTANNGAPVSGIEWDLATLDENGRQTQVDVDEIGLGRYRSRVPLIDRDRLTLRIRDQNHDKLRTFTYNRPYPAEYQLSDDVDAAVRALPSVTDIAEQKVSPAVARKSIGPWFQIAGIICLICGVLVRRL